MSADCLIISNIDTSSDSRRKKSRTANSVRAQLRHGIDLLKKRQGDLWSIASSLREGRAMQRILGEQNSLLIEDQPRDWSVSTVINYVRAGRQVPTMTQENAGRYITWLNDITLNGVILRDYLARNDLSTEVVQTFGFESDDRINRLLQDGPACVVISTTFITLDVMLALKDVRERVARYSPHSKVVVGSSVLKWYTGNYPEIIPTILDHCDFIIDDSQGFDTLCRMVKALKRGEGVESIPNLIYRKWGRVQRTERKPEGITIDHLAPDWGRWIPQGYPGRVTIQTSQGCPFPCRFCDFRLMNRTDYKSVDVLRKELRSLKAIGVTKVDFVDDLFTLPEKRLISICQMMLEEEFNFSWYCLSRSTGLKEETIRLMADAGCTLVNIGLESADPTVLENMNKRTDVSAAYEQVERFSRYGIAVMANIILGYPGETDDSIGRTIEFLNKSTVDAYFLNLFQVGRGTDTDTAEFREEYQLKGEYVSWQHRTGSAREMAGKIGSFVSGVSDDVLRVGGLEDMQMLMNSGYTRKDMASMAAIMKGLAAWERGAPIPPQDSERSGALLSRLGELTPGNLS